MKKSTSGFTIVELLIVIVVIAILAAISVVAYTGIQERAKNSQTTSALNGWIKAIHAYRIENGFWPSGWVCLGENYKYGVSGNDDSGTAQCRQDSTTGFTINQAYDDKMRPFLGGSIPSPAMVTARNSDTIWRRGLMYAHGGGAGTEVYIIATFAGAGECPGVSGVKSINRTVWNGNLSCTYIVGHTTDPI